MTETLRRTLRWRWALIVALFLPSALLAVTMVERQPERHQAASVIAVVPESRQIADNDLIQLAVDRYVVSLQSDDMLLRVADQTGTDFDTVRSGVSVIAAPPSANLRIVAAAPTALQARAIVDAVAQEGVLLAQRDPTVDGEVLAEGSDQSIALAASPRVLQGVLVLTALAVALGLACALELARPRIRSSEDVEAVAGVALLGVVPDFGKHAPLSGGHDGDAVVAAERELRQGFRAAERDGRRGTTYVLGLGRGAGASSVAWMLARSATSQGESVVLVDAEAERAGLSTHLGLPGDVGLHDVLARPELLVDAVDEVYGVEVVGTRPFPGNGKSLRGDQLGEVLKAAVSRWDRVLVDVSATQVSLVAEAATTQAADVVLVVGLGTPATDVRKEIERYRRMGLTIRGVVLNRPTPATPRRRSRVRWSRAPVVLMYHGFCSTRRDDDPENLFVEVAQFEQQLTWLREHDWTPLDLDGYLDARALRRTPRKSFLVTIDDGFPSVAELAAPVLRRLGVPAVLFVPSGLLGESAHWLPEPSAEPIITAEELRHLQENFDIEIGVHGRDHRDFRGLERAELDRQTVAATSELSDVVGREVRCLAYPYGGHDAAARAAAESTGVLVAFSVFEDDGRFAVSRVDVNATDTHRSFRVKHLPHYRRVWLMLQRAPWARRLVRRLTTRTPRLRP
ncbi:hypothetical protein GCM10027020_03910 [Nocardioides salsibiostraticola]